MANLLIRTFAAILPCTSQEVAITLMIVISISFLRKKQRIICKSPPIIFI